MSGLAITITDRGRAALIAARGTNAITIAQIGVTAANFTASPDAQALPGEIKRLSTFSGEASDAYTIHITLRDDSIDAYELRGFALYLSDGTLFGIYGNGPTLIMEKANASMLLLAIDIAFTASDAKEITFGNTNFVNPPATTEREGVVELATEAEAATGTDTVRAVTPKTMLSAVTGWINTRFGNGAPSDFIKSILTSASALALRAALGLKSAALKDEGAGNGLDADKLDGQDGSYFANIAARLGYTPANRAGDAFTGPVSINGSVAWHAGNDGAGSGLDADLLDGQDGAYFANIAARLGYTPANRAGDAFTGPVSINGSMAWHAGNDGAGSGLDADLLDGQDSAFYTAIAARLGYTPLNKAGDTISGTLQVGANSAGNTYPIIYVAGHSNTSGHGSLVGNWVSTGCWGIGADSNANDSTIRIGGCDATGTWNGTQVVLKIGSYIALHSANCGSYAPSLTGKGASGTWDIDISGTAARAAIKNIDNSNEMTLANGFNGGALWMNWRGANAPITTVNIGNGMNTGALAALNASNLSVAGSPVWHPANDGAGSGCDADMLDGYHASSFLDGKCVAYILFYVNNGYYSVVASSGATIQSRQQGGIFYFTVAPSCPIGFAIGMAAPISYSDGISVVAPAQRMPGNGETYHFEFKYASSKTLTDPGWAFIMWF
jgi:hypothetical protein